MTRREARRRMQCVAMRLGEEDAGALEEGRGPE